MYVYICEYIYIYMYIHMCLFTCCFICLYIYCHERWKLEVREHVGNGNEIDMNHNWYIHIISVSVEIDTIWVFHFNEKDRAH